MQPIRLRFRLAAHAAVALALGALAACGGGSAGAPPGEAPPSAPPPFEAPKLPVHEVHLPSAQADDGRYLLLAGSDAGVVGTATLQVRVGAASDATHLDLAIFDGDWGGPDEPASLHCDRDDCATEFRLLADPSGDGSDTRLVAIYDSRAMPDGEWFPIRVDLQSGPGAAARAASGHHLFLLEARLRDAASAARNAFKLRATGTLEIPPQVIGLVAEPTGEPTDAEPWDLHLDLPRWASRIRVWDGNLRAGPGLPGGVERDDPDSPDRPSFAGPNAVAEGENPAPAEAGLLPVHYTLMDGDETFAFANQDPSGSSEWEQFLVETDAGAQADVHVPTPFEAGWLRVHLESVRLGHPLGWRFEQGLVGVTARGDPVRPLRPLRLGGTVRNVATWQGTLPSDAPGRGLMGISVRLLDSAGRLLDSRTTDPAGRYVFEVFPGTYVVEVAGDDFRPYRPLHFATPDVASRTWVVGETRVERADFAFDVPPIALEDFAWIDVNGNGRYDEDVDVGCPPGREIRLLDCLDEFLCAGTVGAGGHYGFRVTPGTYTLGTADATALSGAAVYPGRDATGARFQKVALPGSGNLAIPVWYVVADGGGGNGGNDWLFTVDITLAAPMSNQTAVGTGTGTNNVEAAAFWPGTDTLYATDANILGTIDLVSGVWTRVHPTNTVGSGNGSLGAVTMNDVDGLCFDPYSSILYGTHRRSGNPDLLIQIDTTTGQLIQNAFPGPDGIQGTADDVDYVVIAPVTPTNVDIDDIGIDPDDRQLYGCANGGGNADRLVKIDRLTGAVADVGLLGVNDMEGFSFYNDGGMWGTTGGTRTLYQINTLTGVAFNARPLNPGTDFEALAFLTADLNHITGTVFEDLTKDGTQDVGEAGTAGVTVELWRDVNKNGTLDVGTDVLVDVRTTDANGQYAFDFAAFGDFVLRTVVTTLPAGHLFTTDNLESATFAAGGITDSGNDFGWIVPGTIGDLVWNDANADAVFGAESGLAAVTVNLLYAGPDGVFTTGDDVSFPPQMTDAAGAYDFPGLPRGIYRVDVDESTLPANVILTTGNEPLAVTLTSGQDFNLADFGYVLATASIGDRLWDDLDGDGVQDVGEAGLAGVTVTLLGAGPDGLFGTADDLGFPPQMTDATGAYDFTGLPPGFFRLDVSDATVPGGRIPTTGNDPLDVTLAIAQDYNLADFGYVQPASIGDRVWSDTDADGVQDPGEPGIAAVDVRLYGAGPDGMLGTGDDVLVATDTTDGAGAYDFTGLLPGAYRVDVVDATLPAGSLHTTANDPLDTILTAGADVNAADFGYIVPATIGDRIWDDVDGDGVQDPGELGLPGIDVRLYGPGPDGMLGTADDVLVATDTTDAAGAYDFPGLLPGSYRVDVDDADVPANRVLTTGTEPLNVTVTAGQDYGDADFGYVLATNSIGDRVWRDLDGDGVQDAGEPGIAGVDVRLYGPGVDGMLGTADDVLVATDTTDAAGAYDFPGLVPGTYRVDVVDATIPAGVALITGNDPLDVLLPPGTDFNDADFGYVPTGSIGDRVWRDADADGMQDAGELGLAGVTVRLVGPGPDGMLGTGDDVLVATDTTDAAGAYDFPGLLPGSYRVDVVEATLPAGSMLTSMNEPLDVTLSAGADVNTADFGYVTPGTIGDRVWSDTNGNGVQDPGEPGLNGIQVQLFAPGPDGLLGTGDDVLVATQTTDPAGAYDFTGLFPGAYRVDVVNATLPADALPTTANEPLDVMLAAGQDVNDADFGYVMSATVGDRVWVDADADGIQDPGEPGLAGVTVRLLGPGMDMVLGTADDVVLQTLVTDAAGAYDFTSLPPGAFRVDLDVSTLPAGTVLTTANDPLDVMLAAGQDYGDADFGVVQTGRIGDRVWNDLDGDGVQDAGEPGLPGVTIRLLGPGPDGMLGTADDVLLATQTTDANGGYAFPGLLPGGYRLAVDPATVPAGAMLTTGNDPRDVTLAAGQIVDDVDFGFFLNRNRIGDTVWRDSDGDGVYEPELGEYPLPGVRVNLLDGAGNVIATTVTDGMGRYEFEVPAGTYTIALDPANFGPGGPLAGHVSTRGGMQQPVVVVNADVTNLDFGLRPPPGTAGGPHDCVWWLTHRPQWPLGMIQLGGVTYTADQAFQILSFNNLLIATTRTGLGQIVLGQMDWSYAMAWVLIGAKLNIALGNDASSVEAAMRQADAWLAQVGGVGSNVRVGHPRYAEGRALYDTINTFNEQAR